MLAAYTTYQTTRRHITEKKVCNVLGATLNLTQ